MGVASLLLVISTIFGNFAITDIHVEKIRLTSKGVAISAILLFPSNLEDQRPAILAYHGWGGTKENILTNCLDFVKAGYVVLVPDLRGHGESGGISTLGLLEQDDAKVAIDYLFTRSEVNSSAVSVWGASFGGMISLLAAGTDSRIKATIAVSAPANTTAWLKERDFRTNERISYRPYTKVDPSNLTAVEERSPINFVNNIENLLVMHGELDPLVPVHHAKDLFKASNRSDRHRLIVFKGEEHNINGDRVKQETTQFLKDLFRNPHITVIYPPSVSYLSLMACWLALLLGGLLYTICILSFFPLVNHTIISRWDLQTPSKSSSLTGESSVLIIVISLTSFIGLHIASVLVSLMLTLYYSTLVGLILSTISTIGLVMALTFLKRKGRILVYNQKQAIKWAVETGIMLFFILGIYFTLLLFADRPWVPFINLDTVIRLNPILIGIGIFLGVESFFYWEIIHQMVTKDNKSEIWYILKMSGFYLFSKCILFFTLIFWWNLLEIRFIVYGLGLFGLLGAVSAFIRIKWGFHPTLIFTVLSGLTIYSTFSVLFLLL
ncbi:MAG: alpha/beta hydrolase [Promethearchaeota archaeon]